MNRKLFPFMAAEEILYNLAIKYVDEDIVRQAAENAEVFKAIGTEANILSVLLSDGHIDEATAQKIMNKAKLADSGRSSIIRAAEGLEKAVLQSRKRAEETMAMAEATDTSFEESPVESKEFRLAEKTGTSFERPAEKKKTRYDFVEKLGEGGMGAVYLFQDRLMQRPVALKRIKDGLPENTRNFCIAKFGNEISATALFYECDYLVKAYNVQKDQKGDPFLTLEYVRGETLSDILDKIHIDNDPTHVRKYNAKTLANIFLDICEAVKFMHGKDYVHHDLKPGNVMVKTDGIAKVMDLGLAKRIDDEATGLAEGTPAYMSPEQTTGEQPSKSDDIWALGVILYQMLDGDVPFEGRTTSNIFKKIQEEDPRDIRKTRTGLKKKPIELCAIAMKALEKRPTRRYKTVDDMIADVNAWFEDRPVSAHKDSLFQKATKWMRRNTAATAGIIGGIFSTAAIAAGIAGISFYSGAAARSEARAQREAKEKAVAERNLAEEKADKALIEKKSAEEIADKNKEMADKYLATLDMQKANIFVRQNNIQGAIDILNSWAKKVDFAIIHSNLGLYYKQLGKTELAEKEFHTAISLDSTLFSAYINLAEIATGRNDYAKAEEYYNTAIELNKEYAIAYNNRGTLYVQWDRPGDLERALQDIDTAVKKSGNHHAFVFNRGWIYFKRQEYDSALMDFEEALSKGNTPSYYFMGKIHEIQGNTEEAKKCYEESMRSDPDQNKKKEAERLLAELLAKKD